jgi:hypothetical protein
VSATKIEELAVAARFLEKTANQTTVTQAEIKSVISAARRNFDASNFGRDINNARTKGLFNKGTGKDAYEIRNNRGVGHVGGDVDPNLMDAKVVMEMSKWVMAELVRVFHKLSTADATKVVEALVEKTLPVVWDTGGRRRILAKGLSKLEETLLLLYSANSSVTDRTLFEWVEHSNWSAYKRDVLRTAHQRRLIEYVELDGNVLISPLGNTYVEERLPLEIS